MTEVQKVQWNEIAQGGSPALDPASSREQGARVVIAQPKPVLSGYDAFIRVNMRAVLTGIRAIGNPVLAPSSVFPCPPTRLIQEESPPIFTNFALSFDGTNEDVLIGNVLNYEYNTPFAWEFWIKAPSIGTGDRLIIKSDYPSAKGYDIKWIIPNLVIELRDAVGGGRMAVQRNITFGANWRHCVLTYDGSNDVAGLEIYIDGVPGSVPSVGVPFGGSMVNTAPLTFASWQLQPSTIFTGQLDCIRNFHRNLIQADVDILFNAGAGLYGADPLADGTCDGAWMFCAGAGNTLFDISPLHSDGTLRNMEPIDWVPGHVPCPDIPGVHQLEWCDPTDAPVGSKIRIWTLSYDAGVHKQHVATVALGVEKWIPTTVRVAGGREVPIASVPGHYLFQLDCISSNGNQSPPSNTVECECPFV